MPEVSVIIPVYNSEKYVEKCICSVMAQTLPELEIIIINDGSIDESGKILRKLAQKDSRIILLEQENKGVAAARNLGVEKATGKYLTFVDGDDYLQEDYIEKCTVLRKKKLLIW
ncbi:MAG: glycosyltransferase family 2 protein [Ruminococcus sp.]